ncbi:CDP-alcohol phosphatidyltransferase family protein [Lipingzhangella sp. LS1_29]|uniref:CDP-alcohol phosphatidyltransferase family protein n=1 Tax=Lipingzhangella rawalii TaxID=2055835 RepID=A0ABU2H9L5_9ACTN|nr:CDP-alcohol phosphatidyltransferase family protein [Lipingzhangella rawalii]MDS1271966.1 CDP-alcohol phosphatidyltransferase family protein [Lipingzhangella rawalii]
MPAFTLDDVREQTYKRRDAWWTVLLVDPVAARLVTVTANRTSITPNQLTVMAALLGLAAAACFATASPGWLVVGALLFHASFIVDCMDGKVARLKGTGSVFGMWLDFLFDRIRDVVCAAALLGGQFAATGNPVFLWFAVGVIAVEMFRYLNGPQLAKVRTAMRTKMTRSLKELYELRESLGPTGEPVDPSDDAETTARSTQTEQEAQDVREAEQFTRESPDEGGEDGLDEAVELTPAQVARRQARDVQATELQEGFHRRFPWYTRLRSALHQYRIRSHLFSGIEFTMGVFIIAPLVGAFSLTGMLVTIALCGIFLLAFEIALIYKLWLSTRRFGVVLGQIDDQVLQLRSQLEARTESGPAEDDAVTVG